VVGGGVGGVGTPGRGRVADWEEAGKGAMAGIARTAREASSERVLFNKALK